MSAMEGARSDTVKVQLAWHGRSFYGSTVVEATTIDIAVATTLLLLFEIPDAGIVDRAIALSDAPWAPEEQRSLERVTITAPVRRRGSWAELTWTTGNGTGMVRGQHPDWHIGLRIALAHRMIRPSTQLVGVLDRIRDGANHRVPFQLFGVAAELIVTYPPRRR
jgi:hypothetical protein